MFFSEGLSVVTLVSPLISFMFIFLLGDSQLASCQKVTSFLLKNIEVLSPAYLPGHVEHGNRF